MSFLAPKSGAPDTGQERQTIDNKGPVPVIHGRGIVGMRLIEGLFNHTEFYHGKKRPSSHSYSLVAVGCHGPVDKLHRLWINGKACWMFNATRGTESYVDMSHEWGGRVGSATHLRVYWGTQDQPVEPFLSGQTKTLISGQLTKPPPRHPDGSARQHPPYTGLFYIVFYTLNFDFPATEDSISGRTSVPKIEADVFVRPPGDTGSAVYGRGSNPVAITRDYLTNDVWGAGLPSAMVPEAEWAVKAQELNDTASGELAGGGGWLSPVMAENRDAGEHLASLFSYWDAFVQVRGGKIYPGWFPGKPSTAALTLITRNDLTAEPEVDPEGWEDTLNEVTVRYRNPEEAFGEEAVTERSTYNLQVTQRPSKESISSPAIIHPAPARARAQRLLGMRAEPRLKMRLSLLRSKALNPDGSLILPGNLVEINYEPYGLYVVCRVLEREDSRAGVRLLVMVEPGKYPESYVAVDDPRDLPRIESPGMITEQKLWELPPDLAGRMWPPMMAVIARRPHPGVIRAEVWISRSSIGGGWAQLADLDAWATKASLAEAMTTESGRIAIGAYNSEDLPDELNRDYTDAEQADGYMLALVGDELMSLGEMDDPATEYGRTYLVSRAALGTFSAEHASGEDVWIFRKSDFARMVYEHELFRWAAPWVPGNAQVSFRLAAGTGFETGTPNPSEILQLSDRSVPGFALVSRPAADGGLRFNVTWIGEVGDIADLLHLQLWDTAPGGLEALEDYYIPFTDGAYEINFPPTKAGHSFWVRAWWVRQINHQNQYGQVRWAAYDAEGAPETVQVEADTAAPDDVIDPSIGFDPDRHDVVVDWSLPDEEDIAHIRVERKRGDDAYTVLDRLPAQSTGYVDDFVAGNGEIELFSYRITPVDHSGNEAPGITLDVSVPPYTAISLPSVPEVTAFAASGRPGDEGGLQIDCTWTPDGEAEDDVYIQYWQHIENGVNGAQSMTRSAADGACSIPIPHRSHGAYWVRAYRVRKAEGTAWWSFDVYPVDAEGQPAVITVYPDAKAPERITNLSASPFNAVEKSIVLSWDEPDDADFYATRVYRMVTPDYHPGTFSWNLIDVVPRGKGMFIDHGVYASGEDQYFFYWCRSVDLSGNENDAFTQNLQYVRRLVQPASAPDVTSVSSPEGLQIHLTWNHSAYPDDWMQIQYGLQNEASSERFYTCPYNNGETTILLKKGESGFYWVRAWRVSRFNTTGVWSMPYNHPHVLPVGEDSTIPAKPVTPSGSFSPHKSTVVLTWSPNNEIDLAHYEVWRKRHSSGQWELLDTPGGMRQLGVWVDKGIFWENPQGDTMYYKLVAVDESGNRSLDSDEASITVGPQSAPVFTAVGTGAGPGIVLQWSTSNPAFAGHTMQFQIWPNILDGIKSAIWTSAVYDEGELLHYLDNRHPQIGEENGWWVRGWRVGGRTASPIWSDSSSINLTVPADTGAPDPPSAFGYTWLPKGAALSFALPDSPDLAYVEIQRKEGSGGTYELVDKVTAGYYVDSTTSPTAPPWPDDCYYRIQSVDHAGNRSVWVYSDSDAGQRPKPAMPTGVDVTCTRLQPLDPVSVSADATWTTPAGVAAVRVVIVNGQSYWFNQVIADEEQVNTGPRKDIQGASVLAYFRSVDHFGNWSDAVSDTFNLNSIL